MAVVDETARLGASRRHATRAYTRDVASLAGRLTSLVLAFALTGSPALLAACMAFCLHGSVAAATPTTDPHRGHSAHSAEADPAARHVHHGASAATDAPAATTRAPSQHSTSDARMAGVCTNCCTGGPLTFAADLGGERGTAKTFTAVPIVQVAPFGLTPAADDLSPPSPPIPPLAPSRAPLALRI